MKKNNNNIFKGVPKNFVSTNEKDDKEFFESFVVIEENETKNKNENNPLFNHVIFHLNSLSIMGFDKETKLSVRHLGNFISENKITEETLQEILLNGIPNGVSCIRPLIWKALIGYYPIGNLNEWKNVTINHQLKYTKMISSFTDYPKNLKTKKDLLLFEQIQKDLDRTRNGDTFYQELSELNPENEKETNKDVIKRMLFFYGKFESIGYIQGMNEIIAILYNIFKNDDNDFTKNYVESDTYYTFSKLINELKYILKMDEPTYSQLAVSIQIKRIKNILNSLEPELFNYFKKVDLSLDGFLMKWLLVLFAQEFPVDIAVNFWDRVFTQKDKMKFLCFISAAILIDYKKKLLKMSIEQIDEWRTHIGKYINGKKLNEIVLLALNTQKRFEPFIEKDKINDW